MTLSVVHQSESDRLNTERRAFLALLRMSNTLSSPREIAQQLVIVVREISRCEAIGIRLKVGPEYPYVMTQGFTDSFVKLENSLCMEDGEGRLLRDAQRHPLLACMCGAVLSERVDPAQSFITERGSFWTNATSDLLASAPALPLTCAIRNRCHTAGFETVGLFPIRRDGVTYGMIQCNDVRRDRFTPESLAMLEDLADGAAHLLQVTMA